MTNLLIHNKNVPFIGKFEDNIKFSFSSDSDDYITTTIIPKIKAKNPNIIFIKDNLSSNYLELYGLRLAYHIRFEETLKYLPIVILSDVDGFTLNRLEPMARILFTRNVFILPNNKASVDKFLKKEIRTFEKDDYKTKFLDLISVEPPENSTSHSIANEWAIDRWAEFLKVKSDAIKANREKISSMLYFKYLKALNPLEKSKALGYKKPKLSGKVLYIDDEWDKGWSDIFKSYFPRSITFSTFQKDFKNTNIYALQTEIKEFILRNTPDVVILDLRLIEKDHTREEIENLTGIKFTQIIKEINPAIQVIMFTATSKSRILDELYKHKILGYIKKEDPQEKNIKTKDNFIKLAELVDLGLSKKCLKEVWSIQKSILELKLFEGIEIEIKSVFEILDSEMDNRFIYAMFAIFKAIEIINDYYFIDGYKKAIWRDTEQEISDYSSKNKILLILNKRLQLKNSDIFQSIEEIIKIRNNTIHPSNKNIEKPTKENILTWFKMLQTILEKINK